MAFEYQKVHKTLGLTFSQDSLQTTCFPLTKCRLRLKVNHLFGKRRACLLPLQITTPALYSTPSTLTQVLEETSFDNIVSSISFLTTFSSLSEKDLIGP